MVNFVALFSNIRSQILGGYLFILALLIVIVVTLLTAFGQFTETFDDVNERRIPILQKMYGLQIHLLDMESAERGFLITGDEAFLEPYFAQDADFQTLMTELEELVTVEGQQERLTQIHELYGEWRIRTGSLVEERRTFSINEVTTDSLAISFAQTASDNLMGRVRALLSGSMILIQNDDLPNEGRLAELSRLIAYTYEAENVLRAFIITGAESYIADYDRIVLSLNTNLDQASSTFNGDVRDSILQAQDLFGEWHNGPVQDEISTRLTINNNESAFTDLITTVQAGAAEVISEEMMVLMDDFIADQVALIDEQNTEINDSIQSNTTAVILASIIGTIVALFVGTWIGTRISRNVRRLMQAAQSIAAGNLDEQVTIKSRDEIGSLATAFNKMGDDLRTMVSTQRQRQQKLEQTVSEYLRFVESLIAGNLKARLNTNTGVVEDEADHEMQRLAVNLNEMAQTLDTMVTREKDARATLENTVTDYMRFVERVTKGDLTANLSMNGADGSHDDDDLYQLGVNLNSMVRSLREMAGQVREAASGVSSASAQIQAMITQQTATATEQDAAVTQTVATVEEVRTTVVQTAERAQTVAEASQQSVQVSKSGQDAVTDTIRGMDLIRERVGSIAENILMLSERTQQIGEIIDTVNALADQSKLLALNASIEAARAGEEGKGFAVVAMEVRQLAEQSREATARVRDILSEIQQATNTAVMVTEEGSKGAENGIGLAERAGSSILDLSATIEEAAQAAMQIAASTHQQTNGMDQLSAAMMQIKQATAQTAASAKQTEQSIRDLNAMAQRLNQAAARYEL